MTRLGDAVEAVPPRGPGAEHPFGAAFLALCTRIADTDDDLAAAERAGAGSSRSSGRRPT